MVHDIRIERLDSLSAEAFALLLEYYEAVHVMVRDNRTTLERWVSDPQSGVWVAIVDGELVGCVLLRPLLAVSGAAECKRLYVRVSARGLGIATALMNSLEAYAEVQGYAAVYLDTKDDLEAALALYRARGYQPCERYNDNPQATVFLRKQLARVRLAANDFG